MVYLLFLAVAVALVGLISFRITGRHDPTQLFVLTLVDWLVGQETPIDAALDNRSSEPRVRKSVA